MHVERAVCRTRRKRRIGGRPRILGGDIKMKKSLKGIIAASLMGTFCLGLGSTLVFLNSVQTDAETVSFGMKAGAAVRLTPNSTGLRFIAEMDDDKYASVIDATGETPVYKTGMSLGMVIVPTAYIENAPETTTDWLGYIGNKTKVTLDIPAEKVYEKDGSWCFNGVLTNISFNSLDIDFIGIAYSYDGTAYDYADFTIEDNSRNVGLVASRALNDTTATYGATSEGILLDFVTDSLYRQAGIFAYETEDETLYYESYAAYQADTEKVNGVADIQTVASSLDYTLEYIDVQDSVEFALADGEKTLTVNSLLADADYSNLIEWSSSNENVATVEKGKITAVSGGETTITATLFGKEYKTEVDIVTKYIESASDFTDLVTTEDLNGYYVLTEDITLGAFAGLTSGTFTGIFDGRGHTISGATINPYLFAATAQDATIRNLSIVDSMTRGNPSGTLTNMFKGNSKVENVYINLKQPRDVFTNAQGCLAYQNSGSLQLNNVIVYVPDKYASSTAYTGVFLSSNSGPKVTAVNSHFGSNASVPVVPNGTEEAVKGYNTLADMQTAYANGAIDVSAFKGFSAYNSLRKFLTVAQQYDLGELDDMYLDSNEAYTFTVTQALDVADIVSVKVGEIAISDYSFENGTFTIPASNYANIIGGENVTLIIETVLGHTYTTKIDVITKVLSEASDFTTVATDINGYYVLDKDITLTGTFVGFTTGTFSGIFDGKGHSISGGKISYGLLGKNTLNATVRNLAMIGVGISASPDNANFSIGGLLAHTMAGTTTIENVYLKMNNPDYWAANVGVWAYCVKGTLNATNVVSYVDTDRTNMAAFVSWTMDTPVLNLSNVHCGSAVSMSLVVTAAPATINLTQYTSLADMKTAYAKEEIDISWAANLGFNSALVSFLTPAA